MEVGIGSVHKEFDRFAPHDVSAFLLTLCAPIALIIKSILEWRCGGEPASARRQEND